MSARRVGPVVLGYDDSPAAHAAMWWAGEQAYATGAEVVVVYVSTVVAEIGMAAVQIDTYPIRADVERDLEGGWTAPLREIGVPFRTQVAIGRVAPELMRVAQGEHASIIVIGMTGRGTLAELVFGSTERELLKHAVRPVVAVPASWASVAVA